MIEVKNLTKQFELEGGGTLHAVNGVSFRVNKGEIYGIIGLSGAGKSTLVRCLNRLEEPSSGEIVIDGVELTGLSKPDLLEERKDIGMIFQTFNLFHQKNVYENIAYPLEISGKTKTEVNERVRELLKFIDLEEKEKSYPSQLSGGQKQRVAIARALATNPKILLSDEGTSALDPANTKSVLDLFRKARDEMSMTIIMITHQMEVAKDICDRIAVMEDGLIIEENTVQKLFRSPKNPRTYAFIKGLEDTTEEEIYNPEDFEGSLMRLTFDGESSKEPIISRVIKECDVNINVLSGKINKLHNVPVGYLIVELSGKDKAKDEAINMLMGYNVHVEVV